MEINDINDDDLLLDDPVVEDEPILLDSDEGSGWSQASLEDDDDTIPALDNLDEENSDIDALTEFLKDNGIEDRNKIKFENEDGSIEERAWEDLDAVELLNILRSNQREPETGLDDEEIAFINYLRGNNMTPQLYLLLLNDLYTQLLNAVLQQQTVVEPTYTSSQLNDDELYILDLQSRIPDITDEELEQALINAKSNEDLYKKQTAGIRAEYERLERESEERDLAIALQEQQEQYEQYSNVIANEINNLQNIGDLDITMDDNEMNELAEFILSSDEAGVNHFSKALLDPQTLVQMAWFALHGEEIFNGIADYYNGEIQKAHKAGFEQGYLYNLPLQQPTSEMVYQPKPNKNNSSKKNYISILDLD